jgi:hypothetical protein
MGREVGGSVNRADAHAPRPRHIACDIWFTFNSLHPSLHPVVASGYATARLDARHTGSGSYLLALTPRGASPRPGWTARRALSLRSGCVPTVGLDSRARVATLGLDGTPVLGPYDRAADHSRGSLSQRRLAGSDRCRPRSGLDGHGGPATVGLQATVGLPPNDGWPAPIGLAGRVPGWPAPTGRPAKIRTGRPRSGWTATVGMSRLRRAYWRNLRPTELFGTIPRSISR